MTIAFAAKDLIRDNSKSVSKQAFLDGVEHARNIGFDRVDTILKHDWNTVLRDVVRNLKKMC